MKVRCASYNYQENKWAEYDISADLKLYPCCAYQGYYTLNPWDKDNFKDFPDDWNDLTKHSIDDIQKKMHSVLNKKNFTEGTCPQKCKEICGLDVEERHTPVRELK